MKTIDLNADLAEGCANDEALLRLVSSANISCGLHAGDYQTINQALMWAKENGVAVGAHPSFPDRENFGRQAMALAPSALEACLFYQLGALSAVARARGVALRYVKPHGALYNQAAFDEDLARLIARTIRNFDANLALMGLSGSLSLRVAEEEGLAVISEVFADRRYLSTGALVPRSHEKALLESDDEAIAQVLEMVKNSRVRTLEGDWLKIKADSVCLHGDGAHALSFARKIREALQAEGISVRAGV